MKTFLEFLAEGANFGGVEYETRVLDSLQSANIPGLKILNDGISTAGFHSGQIDIEVQYKRKPFNVEIKKDRYSQMGSFSVVYDRDTERFGIRHLFEIDPAYGNMVLRSIKKRKKALNDYIDKAKNIDTFYNKNISGIPLNITTNARNILQQDGYLRAINLNEYVDTKFISEYYNKKNIYYIQIGGSGLFYMGNNPLNLPIPSIDGLQAQIEYRLGFAGADKSKNETVTHKNKIYPVSKAVLRVTGRILGELKSPYTLDNSGSIKRMFAYINKN